MRDFQDKRLAVFPLASDNRGIMCEDIRMV